MNDETPTPEVDTAVPYKRFQAINEKRAELEARLGELESEVQRWQERAATADTLAQQLEEARASEAASRAQFSEYQAAARLGVSDPELYEAARWAYSRLPEDDRPAFGEALEAWKSDPSAAPLVLRPHLAPAPAAETAAPAQPQAVAPTPPNPNRGAADFPSAPKAVDVMDMTLDQYRQHRAQFLNKSLI